MRQALEIIITRKGGPHVVVLCPRPGQRRPYSNQQMAACKMGQRALTGTRGGPIIAK